MEAIKTGTTERGIPHLARNVIAIVAIELSVVALILWAPLWLRAAVAVLAFLVLWECVRPRGEHRSRRGELVIGSGRKPPGSQITHHASTLPGAHHVHITEHWVHDAEALGWLRYWDKSA